MSKGRYYQKNDGQEGTSGRDKAYDLYASMIIEKLKTLEADWKKPWFDNVEQWPLSVYGKKYHGSNALFLSWLCQKKGYDVPVFGTSDHFFFMNKVKGADGRFVSAVGKDGEKLPFVHVLKGEQAFPVFLTKTTAYPKSKEDGGRPLSFPEYCKLSEEEREKYELKSFLRYYPVFNIDQTNLHDARPELYEKFRKATEVTLPEHDAIDQIHFEPLDRMIADNSWVCPINSRISNRAYYTPALHEITIPERVQFECLGDNGVEYYGTLLHEMAHSTGHESLLGRKIENPFGDEQYGREELVAELTSALECKEHGISKNLRQESCAYLKSWLEAINQQPAFLRDVLSDVKKACGFISNHIDRQLGISEEERQSSFKTVDNGLDFNDDGELSVTECDRRETKEEPEHHEHRGRGR